MAQPVDQITPEVFNDVMAVNLRGVALCMKHEIGAMRQAEAGGAIVNTSSVGAPHRQPGPTRLRSIKGSSKSPYPERSSRLWPDRHPGERHRAWADEQ